MLAIDGSAVGFWVTLVVVVASLAITIAFRRRPSGSIHRRWPWVGASALAFAVVGAVWFGSAIRSDLQYEPPESTQYDDYKFAYDAAPWFGGFVGLLVGDALSLALHRYWRDAR